MSNALTAALYGLPAVVLAFGVAIRAERRFGSRKTSRKNL
jgi:hypothetical protein